MVLVFHQMLVSALLYLTNKLRFIKDTLLPPDTNNSRGVEFSSSAQNALTELWSQSNPASFTKNAESLLRCLLPQAADVLLFILNPESSDLEAFAKDSTNPVILPKSGIASNICKFKEIVQVQHLDDDDPFASLMPSTVDCNSSNQVTLLPLLDKDDRLVGLASIVCKSFENFLPTLEFARNQIVHSLDHMLKFQIEHCKYQRQKTFLEVFGRSLETGVGPFCEKLEKYVTSQVSVEATVVLIVDETSGELYNKTESDDALHEKRIEAAGSIFEDTIQSGSLFNAYDIKKTSRQMHDIGSITDVHVKSILCAPVVCGTTNNVIAVICAFNKRHPAYRFSKADEHNLRFCCSNIAALLENTLEWEKEMVIKRQQEHLLKVAQNLFRHVDEVSVLLNEIMTEAKNLTNAERCSLFLLDRERDELVAKVFDGEIPSNQASRDLRIPTNQGIVGQVAMTGKLLNIKDAYTHPLFYRGLDVKTGFKTRNILCFPIKDDDGVIGVAELCNKANGKCFTKFDEDLTRAFAIYCGISIFHSMLYKRAATAWHRSQVCSELMIYHMHVSEEELQRLTAHEISSPDEEIPHGFDKFSFAPRTIQMEETVRAALYMFDDLGIIDRWKIPRDTLIRFTLMVRKGYRDPPYHNWTHAFTVAHFCYLLLKNSHMESKLQDIERMALFVACLCHDLDHRGTNNAFQVSSNSTLAALYSSEGSVMERHHFAQTVCILNSSGCNIFKNLTESEFEKVLDLIRYIILATDLSHHLRILKDINNMAKEGYKADQVEHRNLLLCLMMTSSDLSDQTKSFEGTRKIADLIYTEFFSQGDLEKVMGFTPMEMMDRERACIPKLQIDFLENIALPVYEVLHELLPETKEVIDTVHKNMECWQAIEEKERQTRENGQDSGHTDGQDAVNGVVNGSSSDVHE